MSYARFSTSDWYIYASAEGLVVMHCNSPSTTILDQDSRLTSVDEGVEQCRHFLDASDCPELDERELRACLAEYIEDTKEPPHA